jgi:MYXO-CTERM domain-containing protein
MNTQREFRFFVSLAVILLAALCGNVSAGTVFDNSGIPDSEKGNLSLVYEFPIPVNSLGWNSVPVSYAVNNAASITTGSFTRVAYYLELTKPDSSFDWVYASFDAAGFTNNAAKIGVPNTASGEYYNFANTTISNMNVYSNVSGIVTGNGITTGNVEFWPSDYGTTNQYGVPNANGSTYDFGDGGSGTSAGHGTMQIHNYGARQTLFAYNAWGSARTSELGVGNQPSGNPDWTFNTSNISNYTARTLQVLVGIPSELTWDGTVNNWGTAHWLGAPPTFPNATSNATVNAGKVTVEANQTVNALTLSGGEVAVGAGNTLTSVGNVNATGGALTMGAGATLSAGAGTISRYSDGGNAATLIKTSPNTLTLDNSTGGISAAGTTIRVNQGTLKGIGDNPLGGASQINLTGSTLVVQGANTTVTNALRGSIFFSTSTSAPWGPQAGNVMPANETPVNLDGATFQDSYTRVFTGNKADTILTMTAAPTLNVAVKGSTQNWTAWTGLFDGNADQFVTALSGQFIPSASGNYQFRWSNDDAGLMYVDMDGNHQFDASERVAAYGWNGTGTKTLTAGTAYDVIYMAREYTGGQGVWWAFTPPSGGERVVNPSDPSQAGMWRTSGIGAINLASTNLTVTGNSTLQATSDVSATFGNLTLNNNVTLATSGAPTTFQSTSITGAAGRSVVINNPNEVNLGAYSDGGAATSFTKRGAGLLQVGNATGSNTSFRIEAGTVKATGANPLGNPTQLTLAGGTLELAPPTLAPEGAAAVYTFDNTTGAATINNGGSLGSTKNATLYGAATLANDATRGSVLSIAGLQKGHLRVNQGPGSTGLSLSGGNWTASIWYKGLIAGGDWHTLYHAGVGDDYQTIINEGTRQLYSLWGGNQNSGYTMPAGDTGWHMITTVGSPGSTKFYIDGQYVSSTTWASTSDLWSIGARGGDDRQQFANNLDDFFFYQRALSPAEVQSLYNVGLTGVYGTPLNMSSSAVRVEGNSTLKIGSGASTAAFGALTLRGGNLAIQGATQGVSFTSGGIEAAATSIGLNSSSNLTINGPYDGHGATATFTKNGTGTLTFAQGTTNHGGVSVQVEAGRLVTGGAMQAANVQIKGTGTNIDTGANDLTISAGGQFKAGILTISGSAAPFSLGGDDLAAGPKRMTLSGGTVTFHNGGMPSGLQAWYDASTLSYDNGASVATWNDLSGNGRTATLNTEHGAVTFATNQLNGLPAVQFRAGALNINSNLFAKEMYYVFRSGNGTNFGPDWGAVLAPKSNWNSSYLFRPGNANFWEGSLPLAVSRNGNAVASTDNFQLGSGTVGNYMVLKIDVNDNYTTPRFYYLGRNESWWNSNLDVAEVLAFNRVLNAAEENSVGGYLKAKYGITAPNYTGAIDIQPINLPTTAVTVTATTTLLADTPSTATFGDLAVKSGATLTLSGAPGGFSFANVGGAGTVAGSLAVRNDLLPGDSAGTLSVDGDLVLDDTAGANVYQWELGPTGHDQVDLSGSLSLGNWTLRLSDAGGEARAWDKLYLFTGPHVNAQDNPTLPGHWSIDPLIPTRWLEFTNPADLWIGIDAGGIFLSGLQTVPEPTALLLALLGVVGLIAWRRR